MLNDYIFFHAVFTASTAMNRCHITLKIRCLWRNRIDRQKEYGKDKLQDDLHPPFVRLLMAIPAPF